MEKLLKFFYKPKLARKVQMDDTDLINSVIKSVTASRDIATLPALKELIAKTALTETPINLLIFCRVRIPGPYFFDSQFPLSFSTE